MNRFFFHFASKQEFVRDNEGRECPDLAAAHQHAMLMMRKAARLLSDEVEWRGWSIKVTDEAGRTVLSVLFPEAGYFSFGKQPKSLTSQPGERRPRVKS